MEAAGGTARTSTTASVRPEGHGKATVRVVRIKRSTIARETTPVRGTPSSLRVSAAGQNMEPEPAGSGTNCTSTSVSVESKGNGTPDDHPTKKQLDRATRTTSARKAALQRRGKRLAAKGGLAAQLVRNARAHEAAKQAKLKRELAATREVMANASRDGQGTIPELAQVATASVLPIVEPPSPGTRARLQRGTENLAETWTPPPLSPLSRVSSVDSSVGLDSSVTVAKSAQKGFAPGSKRGAQTSAVVGDTYADLHFQVKDIYNSAQSTLLRQLAARDGRARDPLVIRMADMVAGLKALVEDIGAMPAGAIVGSAVEGSAESSASGHLQASGNVAGDLTLSDAIDNADDSLAITDGGHLKQQLRRLSALRTRHADSMTTRTNDRVEGAILRHDVVEARSLLGASGVDDADADAAAVAIQAHVRGRQDRRRAAAQKLVALRETRGHAALEGGRCLDQPIDQWLFAQNESAIIDTLQEDYGIRNLWDLIAVVQDPWDWHIVVLEPARCDALWRALQLAINKAVEEMERISVSDPLLTSHGTISSRAALAGDYGSNDKGDRSAGDSDDDPVEPRLASTSSASSLTRPPPPLPQTRSGTGKAKGPPKLIQRSVSPGRSPARLPAQSPERSVSAGRSTSRTGPFTPTTFRA